MHLIGQLIDLNGFGLSRIRSMNSIAEVVVVHFDEKPSSWCLHDLKNEVWRITPLWWGHKCP